MDTFKKRCVKQQTVYNGRRSYCDTSGALRVCCRTVRFKIIGSMRVVKSSSENAEMSKVNFYLLTHLKMENI